MFHKNVSCACRFLLFKSQTRREIQSAHLSQSCVRYDRYLNINLPRFGMLIARAKLSDLSNHVCSFLASLFSAGINFHNPRGGARLLRNLRRRGASNWRASRFFSRVTDFRLRFLNLRGSQKAGFSLSPSFARDHRIEKIYAQ